MSFFAVKETTPRKECGPRKVSLSCSIFGHSSDDDNDGDSAGMTAVEREPPTDSIPPTPLFPSDSPDLAPGLYFANDADDAMDDAERRILAPIRPLITQRWVRGLNTISTVHGPLTASPVTALPSSASFGGLESISSGSFASPFAQSPTRRRFSLFPDAAAEAPAPKLREPVLQTEELPSLTEPRTMVCVHGYGGGIGNYVPVWRSFAEAYDVHALDLPGFGRSVRPKGKVATVDDAVAFFVGRLEAWFEAMTFKGPVVLVAHSFGAYVSSFLAMRRPDLVAHLVLVDPWGVTPFNDATEAKEPLSHRLAFKVMDVTRSGVMGVMRTAGPLGRTLLERSRPELGQAWEERCGGKAQDWFDYTYHCNAQEPVGEMVFSQVSVGVAKPIKALSACLPTALPAGFHVSFIFGLWTYLDVNDAFALSTRMHAAGIHTSFDRVREAGHQLLMENPVDFAATVLRRVARSQSPQSPPSH